ncbi:MAG: hypothetical protein HYV54_02175 [Parcubacteria group bacterium]|nr:hypothetical protein [Parcubacteria group bacterium]
MSNNIFHEYDIRGLYPDQINENIFCRLGQSIKHVLKPKKIAIARDGRLSSDSLFLYLSSALAQEKIKVIDLGRTSAPFCFWYSQKYKTDALMITASHNPAGQNGLKIYTYKSGPIDKQTGLEKIRQKYELLPPNLRQINLGPKNIKKVDVRSKYQKFILGLAGKISPKIKLAVDFSNGSGAAETTAVLEKLKVNFATLNEKVDGRFPGHSPNPLDEASQKSMKALVKSKKLNLGAVIDGDGDRIIFFDETGTAVDSNFMVCLMIDHGFFSRNAAVVKTVSMGRIIDEIARDKGLKVYVSKVGRSHVRRLVKNKKAVLGAEKSGHYFFKEYYFGDSALVALMRVLEIISKNKKSLSQLVKPYQKYIVGPEISIPFKGRTDHIIKTLKDKFKDGQLNELDGLKIDYPDWGFNLRKSNTEPVWRLTLEGLDKNELGKHRKEIEEILI